MPYIGEYFRGDGTRVRAHWRSPSGAGRQTGIIAVVLVAVFVLGDPTAPSSGKPNSGTAGPDRAPRPTPTVSYPIKWPGWPKPAVRPTPTVTYPIPWDRSR